MNKIAAFIALAVLATGCVTSQEAPTYAEAPVPSVTPDQSVLYIFREFAQPTAWASYLDIDGQQAASLNQQGFTWVYLQPGQHKFKFGWPALAGMPSVSFDHTFEGGKVYAFQMHGKAGLEGMRLVTGSAVQAVEFEVAQKNMSACCRYVAPKVPVK